MKTMNHPVMFKWYVCSAMKINNLHEIDVDNTDAPLKVLCPGLG